MRIFLCNRLMPIGGNWDNPKYRDMKFTVGAVNAASAAKVADDVQADAKVKRWGKKPMVKM